MTLASVSSSFLLPLLILLLRNGIPTYRSLITSSRRSPHPPSRALSRALNLLFASALLSLLSTTSYLTPHNILSATASTASTPTEIIFSRLAALRPLTPTDHLLKSHLTTKDARALYLTYGPDVLATCPFCAPSTPRTYLLYALPALLARHIAHLAVLGAATSAVLVGREGAQWRSPAALLGCALVLMDLYLVVRHDFRVADDGEGVFGGAFYWRMRLLRGVCVAGADALLGWAMWLSGTGRFFVAAPSVAGRLEVVARGVEGTNYRLWAAGNVRNAVGRDEELRRRAAEYWTEEKTVYEEREVVVAVRAALERMDVQKLTDMAGARAEETLGAALSVPTVQRQPP